MRTTNTLIKTSISHKIFSAANYLFLTLLALSMLIPFLYVLSISIRPEIELAKYGSTLIPRSIDFEAYEVIFRDDSMLFATFNTIRLTLLGTLVSMITTVFMSYPLSKELPYKKFVSLFVYITMLFGGGLVPTYLLVEATGLKNTIWSMIIPVCISPFNMIIIRNYFQDIPIEIEEAAIIDGCSPFRTLIKVIIPLSLPIIATMTMFYAIGYWNEWFSALIYFDGQEPWSLQLYLRNLIIVGYTQELQQNAIAGGYIPPNETIKMAVIIIATIPVLCFYPFVQKYFIKGLTAGAVKG